MLSEPPIILGNAGKIRIESTESRERKRRAECDNPRVSPVHKKRPLRDVYLVLIINPALGMDAQFLNQEKFGKVPPVNNRAR